MVRAVADTHSIIWYLFGDTRLSVTAKTAIENAELGGEQIAVSSITLIEIVYLSEKGRLAPAVLSRILDEFDRPSAWLVEVPVGRHVAQAMETVDRAQVPDMPDRIIAATGVYLKTPVISRDRKIEQSDIVTIW